MAYNKRLFVTAISVVYLLILTALAYFAHISAQRYSLPLPSLISGLLVLAPALTGLSVERLTRIPSSSSSTAITILPSSSYGTFPVAEHGGTAGEGATSQTLVRLLPRHHLRTQLSSLGITILLTALASLASPYLARNRGLSCALENTWRDLFDARQGGEIQLIQDAWQCCGLHTVNDMAWPFPSRTGSVTERERCTHMYGRDTSCYGPWEEEERRVAGVLISVTAGVWLWKMLVLFTPHQRPSWLTTRRTPPPAPPRATQQAARVVPRAFTTISYASPPPAHPPPPRPETDPLLPTTTTFSPTPTQNIGTNASKERSSVNGKVTFDDSTSTTNNHLLAKSLSRNIPKRERNRPTALDIPYYPSTPDGGYANSPGPEVSDLETASPYHDSTLSDSEVGSQHQDRADRELFINGAPSPLPAHCDDVDATATGGAAPDPPALSLHHLRLTNGSSKKGFDSNSADEYIHDLRASQASPKTGVHKYRRPAITFKFPVSPPSRRSSNTGRSSEPALSKPSLRPQSPEDAASHDEGKGEGVVGMRNGRANSISGSESEDSMPTAVEHDGSGGGWPPIWPVCPGPRRFPPRPRSRHPVLNGSVVMPRIDRFGVGGVYGQDDRGVGGVKPHTVIPAVLITEVSDDDDDDDDAGDKTSVSRDRFLTNGAVGKATTR